MWLCSSTQKITTSPHSKRPPFLTFPPTQVINTLSLVLYNNRALFCSCPFPISHCRIPILKHIPPACLSIYLSVCQSTSKLPNLLQLVRATNFEASYCVDIVSTDYYTLLSPESITLNELRHCCTLFTAPAVDRHHHKDRHSKHIHIDIAKRVPSNSSPKSHSIKRE